MDKTSLIKIDIDHRRNYKRTKSSVNFYLRWIDYYFQIFPCVVTANKTHKGFHFVVATSHKFEPPYIIAFQLIIGSDRIRELRNLNRVASGMTNNWNLLFSEKFRKISKDEIETISKEKLIDKYELV